MSEGTWLRELFENYLGEFLNELSAGEKYVAFEHDKLNIVPLICYETTFSEFVAGAIQTSHDNNSSKSTLLVALSNDAWFGSKYQSYQHIIPSALRAVETRSSFLHVVNNGPSLSVSPSGKITRISEFQTAGGFLTNTLYPEQGATTFYTQYPNFLKFLFYIIFVFLGVKALMGRRAAKAKL
jgi:apolipoprotein N-acyltransferase